FSVAGTYVVQLAASDGQLTSTAQLTIAATQLNHAPVVNAGADQTLASPTMAATLAGSATDDGLPTGSTLSYAWSLASGPAAVTAGNASAATTTVAFPYPGSYVLRLSVSDTDKVGTDDVAVNVGAPSGAKPTVSIAGIADDAVITKPTPILGTISGGAWMVD